MGHAFKSMKIELRLDNHFSAVDPKVKLENEALSARPKRARQSQRVKLEDDSSVKIKEYVYSDCNNMLKVPLMQTSSLKRTLCLLDQRYKVVQRARV